jgi:DNA-binding transcriptional ArsR family regulator
VERGSTPSLLPILRSQQQAELLALLLGDPDLELSLTELATRLGVPHPSVHREVTRAEAAGIVTSRKVGNTRLVKANAGSPYYASMAELLTRAFGAPAVIGDALRHVAGVVDAFIFGSWAARHTGVAGKRPVEDIDLLVLGDPDRDALYQAIAGVEARLGRPVQVTVRDADWLETGEGSFHDTVVSRPMVRVGLAATADSGD